MRESPALLRLQDVLRQVDSFYHLALPGCAADNTARPRSCTDLAGRRALLTGGRVKIGFQLALMMLRDGAERPGDQPFPARHPAPVPRGARQWAMARPAHGRRRRPARPAAGTRAVRAAARGRASRWTSWSTTPPRPSAGRPSRTPCSPPGRAARCRPECSAHPASRRWPRSGARSARSALPSPMWLPRPDEAGLLPDPSPGNSWSARLG